MKQNIVNIENIGNKTYYWVVNDKNQVEEHSTWFKPYFYVEDHSGEFETIDGRRVSRIYRNSQYEVKEAANEYPETWEVDVDPISRFINVSDLYQCYKDSGILPVRTWFIDIECLSEDHFPDPWRAANKLTAISFYDTILEKTFTITHHSEEYKHFDKWKSSNVLVYESEQKMLLAFISFVEKLRPQILSGWNSEEFDYPYILNRIKRILGDVELNKLSPINKTEVNAETKRCKIYGITELDYLKLYKKFSINERSSYSLNSIAIAELGEKKEEHTGNLDDLWIKNFDTFIKYNRKDVELVKKINDKFKFITLAREITVFCNVHLRNIWFNSSLHESLILSRLKDKNIIANNKITNTEERDAYAGAYVKDPIIGKHDWVVCFDLVSLYPSIIRTLNMSIDTIMSDDEVSIDNEDEYFKSSNNAYFSKNKRGIIPLILDDLFNQRVEYKKLLKEAAKNNDKELAELYDMRQYTLKILLNSMYGYIGMSGSRFYERRIAEGVTLSGQSIIKSSIDFVSEKYPDVIVIYGDTDSIYFSLSKIPDINKEKSIEIGNEILQNLNNNHLKDYALKKFNVAENDTNYFKFNFEKLALSGLFISKKRYALNLIWKEGIDKNNDITVTGIETVRSDTPLACKDILTHVIENILTNLPKEQIDNYIIQFKDEIKNKPIIEVGFPTGVKGIKKYMVSDPISMNENSLCQKGTPVHVKAAINYNTCFTKNGRSMDFPVIKDHEKIKWIYIKETPNYPFSVMAFTENTYKHMELFSIDWNKVIQRLVDQKIHNIYESLAWAMPVDKNEMITEDLFE